MKQPAAAFASCREEMLHDLEACAEIVGESTLFGLNLRRNIESYRRELESEAYVPPRESEQVQTMLALDLLLDVAYHDGGARDLAVAAEAYSLAGYHDGAIIISHASHDEVRERVARARYRKPRVLLRHDAAGVLYTVRTLIHEGLLDGNEAARRANERWKERGGHDRAA